MAENRDTFNKYIEDAKKQANVEIDKLKRQDLYNKIVNPSDISARLREQVMLADMKSKIEEQKRLNEYNSKQNKVIDNKTINLIHNGKSTTITWESEKLIDSTIRELLSVKVNLMKEALESLGIEFQNTTQYNPEFIRYNNRMIDGAFEGEPSHETIDTAIVVLYSSLLNGDFPIPQIVLDYIKEMIGEGFIYEERISNLLVSDTTLERGKTLVQTMVNAGISSYVAIAIAGALFVESGWNAVKCPEQTEFGGLISGVRYKLNEHNHNWADAGEGLFGLTFWKAKEKIITDPEFEHIRSKYNIPTVFEKYNKDLAAGRVDTMYVANWKGTSFEASGHLSNLELDEWAIPLKIFLKGSQFWTNVFENTPEHNELIAEKDDEYLTSCLAASYLFKAGGKNPTFEEGKYRSYVYRKQHISMGYSHIQDGWATQLIVSIVLSKYIKGEPVKTYDDLIQTIYNM